MITARERRSMAGVPVAAAVIIALYWIAWLTHRSLVASEMSPSYEDAFPLADAWLALCLVAAAFCLPTARRAALFWLLAGGGAGMDGLYDLQHGIWGKGGNGLADLVTLFVLRWAWHALAS